MGTSSCLRRFEILLVSFILAIGLQSLPVSDVAARADKPDDAEEELEGPGHACDRDPPGRALGLERKCPPPTGSSAGIARGDFDCDGRADLAIGVPFDNVSIGGTTTPRAGAVNVVYQSAAADRLSSARNQIWHQGRQGPGGTVIGTPTTDDQFGASLASGDFNRDGCSDLAIGVPGEEVFVRVLRPFPLPPLFARFDNAGAVHVLYGKPVEGLTPAFNEYLTQGFSTLSSPFLTRGDFPESNDRFGSSLAWGDFNADGSGDLAVGVTGEDVVTAGGVAVADAGAVQMFIGLPNPAGVRGPTDPGGLNGGTILIHQDVPAMQLDFFNSRVPGRAETGDQFGHTLTAGLFNGDQFFDLAIGVRAEDVVVNGVEVGNAGAVNVIYGSANWLQALTPIQSQFWNQASTGVADTPEASDLFGSALAAGNFNGDNFDDLAIGVPTENDRDIVDAGGVNVILGSANGISPTVIAGGGGGNLFLTQDSDPGGSFGDDVVDQSEPGDRFGSALAAGSFDSDGFDDLAIGAPREDLRDFINEPGCTFLNNDDAGAVTVQYGSALSFLFPRSQFLFQGGDTAVAQPRFQYPINFFGSSLTAWNFGHGPNTDLAVGVPGDSLDNFGASPLVFGLCFAPRDDGAGAVEVLYGQAGGFNLFRSLRMLRIWASSLNQKFHQVTDFPTLGISLQGFAEEGDRFGQTLY